MFYNERCITERSYLLVPQRLLLATKEMEIVLNESVPNGAAGNQKVHQKSIKEIGDHYHYFSLASIDSFEGPLSIL